MQVKALPNSVEIEKSLLGAMILDPSIADVVSFLKAEDFYASKHIYLFQVIKQMRIEGGAVDLVTLRDGLLASGDLQKVGGVEYLMELEEAVPAVANAEHYARAIKEDSTRRQAIAESYRLCRELEDRGKRVTDVLSEHEGRVCELLVTNAPKVLLLEDVLSETMQILEARNSLSGIPTGFIDIDEILGGFHTGEYYILAGRPSMGKTCLAWNFIEHVCLGQKIPTLVFSLEVGAVQCCRNILARVGQIEGWRMRKSCFRETDWVKLNQAADKLSEGKIFLSDSANVSIEEIISITRSMKLRHGIGMVVVDYLGLVSAKEYESKEHETSLISNGLKRLARELDVPVLAVAQLNRRVELREDKRPIMSDLRDSGSIEQDADVVMLLYRDEYYNRNTKDKGVAELHVAKHRNGLTGVVNLAFIEDFVRFENLVKTDQV